MVYGSALRSGRLSPVMPGWTLPVPQLFAVFVSRQGMVPAVRAFVDYLVEKLDEGKHTPTECPTQQELRAVKMAALKASEHAPAHAV
jgi:hypothetical protein